MSTRKRRAAASPVAQDRGFEEIDASLLDIVDHVLTKGIVLTGDLVLGVADIDLVYLRLSAVLCAADRILGNAPNGGVRKLGEGEQAPSPVRKARSRRERVAVDSRALISSRLGPALGKKR